jgi:histidyl-tRNA synthetase
MAMYRDIPRPFKRYQIQPVWRYDKPDPGRFREFLQFDIDTVGTKSMVADAEIITAMSDSLTRLGLKSTIRFSNRKVLNSLLVFAGLPAEMAHQLFRVLDKLDKQGLKNVILELGPGRTDDSGDKIAGLGLEDTQIARIEQFLSLNPKTRREAIKAVSDLFEDVENAEEGIRELTEISEYLDALDIPDDDIVIDLGIARGLDYYTGPVFEAVLTDKRASRVGSVMGGGRYDDLIGRFTSEPVPATGASIGIDRLFAAVRLMEGSDLRSSTADVLVTVMMPERITDYAKVAQILRREGINTELYTGRQTSIGKQLKYADRQGVPLAVIIGSDEFDAGQVSIKDLGKIKREEIDIKDRKEWVKEKVGQITIPASDLVNTVRSLLAGS